MDTYITSKRAIEYKKRATSIQCTYTTEKRLRSFRPMIINQRI